MLKNNFKKLRNFFQKSNKNHFCLIKSKICNIRDLKEGQINNYKVQDGEILITKLKNEYFAFGSKCTHFQFPLKNGLLFNDRLYCPLHLASFSIKTGYANSGPTVKNLPTYKIEIIDEDLFIYHPEKLREEKFFFENENKKLIDEKSFCGNLDKNNKNDFVENENKKFVIIGGGPAGLSAIETLRQSGFNGKLICLTKEEFLPYDRTLLNKVLFDINYEKARIRNSEYFENLDVEFKFGNEVINLDNKSKEIFLKSGEIIKYDKVLIATGCNATKIKIKKDQIITKEENIEKKETQKEKNNKINNIKGIFSVRNLEDVKNIQKFSNQNDIKNVVIIGSSFIALETAGCLKSSEKKFDIIIVNKKKRFLQNDFGLEISNYITKFIEENGIIIKNNVDINNYIIEEKKIKEIILNNGEKIKVDLLIYGIGANPSTNFISENLKEKDMTIKVDKYFRCLKDQDIFAIGDISTYPTKFGYQNIKHYSEAFSQGQFAAFNMLNKKIEFKNVPFFWTRFFNKSFCYIGYPKNNNNLKNEKYLDQENIIIKGDLEKGNFIGFYFDDNECYGVSCCGKNSDLVLINMAMMIGIKIYKEDVEKENFFENLKKKINNKSDLCKCMKGEFIK